MKRLDPQLLLLAPALALAGALFVLPLLFTVEVGLFETSDVGAHLRRFLNRGAYLEVFYRTVWVSLAVAGLCTLIGYPVAYFIARQPADRRALLIFLVLVPMWMSILVRTYSWMVVLGREGLVNATVLALGLASQPLQLMYTTGAVYLAMVQILLPFGIMACLSAMADIDDGLVRAARILGASPAEAFRRVYLPLSLEGVGTGFTLTFMLSMGFFIIPALVGGPRDALLANLIATQVEHTNWSFAAALSCVLLLATLAIVTIIRALARVTVFSPGRAAA